MSDVVFLKASLRKSAKEFRNNLLPFEKQRKDEIIFQKVMSLDEYKNAETVLCYYSTDIEVDTLKLIDYSLKQGKRVALPKCTDNLGHMQFKLIESVNSLENGAFGIKEPSDNCELFTDSENAICIVPALMIDDKGYRLGYGKGYYDNFLKSFRGAKCVICYKENVIESLPFYDGFDIKCDVCITD